MSVPMIESVHFQNFKALRDTTLPLGRFTLIVGANGSGKSTAMQAIKLAGSPLRDFDSVVSSHLKVVPPPLIETDVTEVEIKIKWETGNRIISKTTWRRIGRATGSEGPQFFWEHNSSSTEDYGVRQRLVSFRAFLFNSDDLVAPVKLRPQIELEQSGRGLAGVLDNLRDEEPERFEALNNALQQWLPEYDRVLFENYRW